MPLDTRPTRQSDTDETDPNLDQGWAWIILVSALLTHILTFGLAYASVGAFYVELLAEFKQSEAATSWTGAILLGVMLCSGPISSLLVANFGAMVTAMTGGALASSGLVLSALAPRLTYLYLTFGVLTGFGFGLSYLPCIVMLGKFFERRRSMACGLAVSGSGVGTFIFAPLTQYCIQTVGWRVTFVILGGCCLVLCVCGATYRTSKLPKKFQDEDGSLALQNSSSSVFLFFSDMTSVAAEPMESSEYARYQYEKDVETQTVVTYSSDQRDQFQGVDGIQLNTSNNAICEGRHCHPEAYMMEAVLHDLSHELPVKYQHSTHLKMHNTAKPQFKKTYGSDVNKSVQKMTPDPQVNQSVPLTTNSTEPTTPSSKPRLSPRQSVSRTLIQPSPTPPLKFTDDHISNNQDTPSLSTGLVDQSTTPTRFQISRHIGPCLTFGHLLKNLFFVLFCLSNLIMCIGYQLPYMYFKAFALSLDISENDWSYILSIMGITDMVGRIIVGFIFDRITGRYNRLFGFMCASILSGVFLVLVSFSNSFIFLAILASLYSLLAGSTDSLVPALLAHFVGIDTLAYSFGMVIEMQGTGFLIGPPIAGTLYKLFGERYEVVFYTGGIAFILAGVVLLLQPLLTGRKANCCNRCRR